MKWMWSSALALAVSAVVSAHSSQMKQPQMGESTNMTYTGCLVAINHGGTFLLTHFAEEMHGDMHGEMHDKMDDKMHDKMDGKMDGKMQDNMHDDKAATAALVLTGRSDLNKHVGHKVTVTGSVSRAMSGTMPAAMPDGRDTLAITSLKMVAKSCS